MYSLTYNTADRKKQLTFGANYYTFRHQQGIISPTRISGARRPHFFHHRN